MRHRRMGSRRRSVTRSVDHHELDAPIILTSEELQNAPFTREEIRRWPLGQVDYHTFELRFPRTPRPPRDYVRDRDLALRFAPPFSLARFAEPRTDDMRQMLEDLGLETPKERLLSWIFSKGPRRF